MQLRKRKSGLQADPTALLPPATPAAALRSHASGSSAQTDPNARVRTPRKPKRPPQDIGIETLVLGAGQAVADAIAAVAPATAGSPLRLTDMQVLQQACDGLAIADPALEPLIAQHGPPVRLLAKSGSSYATLAKSICFQQLATNAAAAIYGRVLNVCGCEDILTPPALLAAPPAELRAAGLSERKVSYLQDLSTRFESGHLSDELIYGWDPATLHTELIKVKGIGDWSIDMFEMFHRGDPDCLPVGDLGVRKGMQELYKLKDLPSPAEMQALAQKWQPYRSVGSYFMWRVEVSKKKAKRQ